MGKVAEELGPTLPTFLGEVLYNDLSTATTVAEAAELARGFKGAVDALLSVAKAGNGFGSSGREDGVPGWEIEAWNGLSCLELHVILADRSWAVFVDEELAAEGCDTNGTTAMLSGAKALLKELTKENQCTTD